MAHDRPTDNMTGPVTPYVAPVDAIDAAFTAVGIDELLMLPAFAHLDRETVRDVVRGFGDLAAEVIAPTDGIGDVQGPVLHREEARVEVPAPLADAFAAVMAGGWPALGVAAEWGGGGFPRVVAVALHEIFGSANLALSLGPMLSQSAIELLERWGDERQQRIVIPRLVSGVWSGTMNLTEPDAGSDLGGVRTVATPRPDGRYAISGTKIYITWGEHELVENIVHLVLARTPGAPVGTRGISVFMVPKFEFDEDGRLGARNRVRAVGIEHKMGIRASPTCVMEFDGAVGELVGPECGGMEAMFSMMNPARLAVGVQGVSIGERALQHARQFAAARVQGRSPGRASPGPSPILEHPDVRRTLAIIAATLDAARLLTYATAVAADVASHHPDPAARERARRRADLLTPLAKSWPTDQGVRMASSALQVFGGMGFIEETGIAQRLRDSRIAPIYEGTNGIQAIDLVVRKVVRDGGVALTELLDDTAEVCRAASGDPAIAGAAGRVEAAVGAARAAQAWVLDEYARDPRAVLAGASPFQQLLACVAAGGLFVRDAMRAGDDRRSVTTARLTLFAAEHVATAPAPADIALGIAPVDAALD